MLSHLPPNSAIPSYPDDVDAELLRNAQAYLECLAQRRTPGRALHEAWVRFYHICDGLLRRLANWRRLTRDDRDDCVQQVWSELVVKLPGFDYDPRRGRFGSWLRTLVRSKAADLHRLRAKHRTASLARAGARLWSPECDPSLECERQSEHAAVRQLLAELRQHISEPSYRLLHLRWQEGRTVRETAAALDLTPAQVWSREHRLRRKLGALFQRYANTG